VTCSGAEELNVDATRRKSAAMEPKTVTMVAMKPVAVSSLPSFCIRLKGRGGCVLFEALYGGKVT